jgi:hypothetical protein
MPQLLFAIKKNTHASASIKIQSVEYLCGPQYCGVGRVVTGVIKITLESWARIGICQSILLYLPFNQRLRSNETKTL